MGYGLSKPYLRAKIESYCNEVATRNKNKAFVLNEILNEMMNIYKGVYILINIANVEETYNDFDNR